MGTADTLLVIGLLAAGGLALWYFSGSFPGPAGSTLQWRQNPVTGQFVNFFSGSWNQRSPGSIGFPGTVTGPLGNKIMQTSNPIGSGGGVGGEGKVGGSRQAEILKREKAHSAKYIAYY